MGEKKGIVTNGLVLRATEYRENDMLLTVLCEYLGKITVCGKGLKSLKNVNRGGSQPLMFSEFVLNERNGFYTLSECAPLNTFNELNSELEQMLLACYVVSVADYICMEGTPEPEILRLSLNILFALSKKMRSYDCIKAVYEIRTAYILGLLPSFDECAACGKETAELWYSVTEGDVLCTECVKNNEKSFEHLSGITVEYLKFLGKCDGKKILAVEAEPDWQTVYLAEKILLNCTGKSFPPLQQYNRLKNIK